MSFTNVVERAIQRKAKSGKPFTADDVRPSKTEPDHPNQMGLLFRHASQAGLIQPVGWITSTRPSRHGAPIRLWIGTRS